MKIQNRLLTSLATLILGAVCASAKINIVTSTTEWASMTKSIAGDLAEVSSVARGVQDPHFIEAKPSYMVKVSHADLVISTGLQLEVGWLPLLLRGARRPNLLPGSPGYLEVSQAIQPIEVTPNASRAQGDVHPFGNPHFSSDPVRMPDVARLIAQRLGELDPPHAAQYEMNLKKFDAGLKKRTADWERRMAKFRGTKVIGYHKTFDYFFDRFGLEAIGFLEPKPGIPPTASHVLALIGIAKSQKPRLVFNENYFDPKPANTLAAQVPGLAVLVVPAHVGGDDKSRTYEDWMETLVSAVERGMKP